MTQSDTIRSDMPDFSAFAAPKNKWLLWFVKSRGILSFFQGVMDVLTIFATYWVSYVFYTEILDKWSPQSLTEFMSITVVAAVIYLVVLERQGLYRRQASLLNIKELRGIFHSSIYAAAMILSVTFYFRSFSLSRIMLTIALAATPIFLYIQRQLFYRLSINLHQRGIGQRKVLIYGAGGVGIHLAKRMFESPWLGFLPVGFLDDDVSKTEQVVKWGGIGPKNGLRVLGGENLLDACQAHGVEMLFISLPSAKFERNQSLVEHCVNHGIEYAVVPQAYEKFIENFEWFEIGGVPILRKGENHVSWYFLAMKRVVDFLFSATVLLIFSPLYFLIGLAIKLDSKGPVIFKQKRVGLRGREFSFYKFRSMHIDAPKYMRSPSDAHDPRITRVGRWLRRTSLDELPQLFNVFRGDMSLVGPRPEMPFIVANYTPLERQRLQAKPGITGVWQISAVRGEPIHANLEYDLFYLKNRSILLDLAVIIKTIFSVVWGIGAV